MNNFDLSRMLTRFTNANLFAHRPSSPLSQSTEVMSPTAFSQSVQLSASTQSTAQTVQLQMNTLQSMDRAVYAKEVMQLPRNLNEFVYMLQNGMTTSQFNQMFAQHINAQRSALSQTQAQILAQLQGLAINTTQINVQAQLASQLQSSIKNLALSPDGMLDLEQISLLLQSNGKEALTKIISSMTQASKQGITDLSQLKDMAKLVNASVAAAAQKDSAQTLKVLMLLYLPWLPLEEGVGFDLDIETDETSESGDSILTITISTVNYGTVSATLVLETQNSVNVSIECSKEFPKDELLLRIEGEQKQYSMSSVITCSYKEAKSEDKVAKAKINMNQTTKINPFLLLMAHTIIRHTIEIDNNKSMGVTSHKD